MLHKLSGLAVTLVGLLLSVLLSILLYYIGVEASLSLLFGMVGLVVTLQIDIISRFLSFSDSTTRSFPLMRLLSAQTPWFFSCINDIIVSVENTITSNRNPLFSSSARYYLEQCRDHLGDLARGYLRVGGDDKGPLLEAVRNAKTRIRACSYAKTDLSTWLQPSGERYLAENLAAARRGLQIERIFIYDSECSDLSTLIARLTNGGTAVYTIEARLLPPERCVDLVIFDDSFAYESRPGSDGRFYEGTFSLNESDVNRKIREFNYIKSLAHDANIELTEPQPSEPSSVESTHAS